MDKTAAAQLHTSLNLAGFRAHAAVAGLLQLCRELEATGLLSHEALARIQDAIFNELIEQVPRSLIGDPDYARRLKRRLGCLSRAPAISFQGRARPRIDQPARRASARSRSRTSLRAASVPSLRRLTRRKISVRSAFSAASRSSRSMRSSQR